MNDVYHVLIFDCETNISSEESRLLTSCNDMRIRHYKNGSKQGARAPWCLVRMKFHKVLSKINRKQDQFMLPGKDACLFFYAKY